MRGRQTARLQCPGKVLLCNFRFREVHTCEDHKPDLASERARIERTGGNVQEAPTLDCHSRTRS